MQFRSSVTARALVYRVEYVVRHNGCSCRIKFAASQEPRAASGPNLEMPEPCCTRQLLTKTTTEQFHLLLGWLGRDTTYSPGCRSVIVSLRWPGYQEMPGPSVEKAAGVIGNV